MSHLIYNEAHSSHEHMVFKPGLESVLCAILCFCGFFLIFYLSCINLYLLTLGDCLPSTAIPQAHIKLFLSFNTLLELLLPSSFQSAFSALAKEASGITHVSWHCN